MSSFLKQLHLRSWWESVTGRRLAPYVPTPQHVVERMLSLAAVAPGETLHDVGAGDGRMLITAARTCRARGVGYELDEGLVETAQRLIAEAGVASSVTVLQQDALTADYSSADVVTLYLSDHGNAAVLPLLKKATAVRAARGLPGARVVTFYFPLSDEPPAKTAKVNGISLFMYQLEAEGHGRGGG
jgi:Methyltransferase domain